MYFRIADWLKAITLVAIVFLVFIIARTIANTLLIFALAALVAFVLNFIVSFLVSKKVNRVIAIIFAYIALVIVILIFGFLFVPVIVGQFIEFAEDVPDIIQSLREIVANIEAGLRDIRLLRQIPLDIDVIISQATTIVINQLRNLLFLIPPLIGFMTNVFLILFIAAYILFFLPVIARSINENMPGAIARVFDRFFAVMKTALGRYILGQLALMIAVGILSGFALFIIGIPFPALLGLWAGLTEIIPILGPILGAIPAVFIALTIDPVLALWVILAFIIVQQTESSVLSPLILGGVIVLNPLLILFSIVAGAELAGILGILLAVPLLVIFVTIFRFARENFSYERVEDGADRLVVKDEDF